MPAKKYHVALTEPEREQLVRLSTSQRHSARQRKRARILLLADVTQENGGQKDSDIAAAVRADAITVSRVRQRFDEGDLEAALHHKEQEKRKERLLDGAGEAHLIALTCSAPPDGHKRWSLHLLKDTLIEQQITDTISHETVRQTLKKCTQALAEKVLVHPARTECRVCLPHGRRAGCLPASARCQTASGLLGRSQQAASFGHTATRFCEARAACSSGQRIQAQWHGQLVHAHRAALGLAAR